MKYTNLMQLWLRRTLHGECQLFSWPVSVIVGLIPCGLLVTSNASFAEIPHTAEIVQVSSSGEGPRVHPVIGGGNLPARPHMQLHEFNDRLEVPPDNLSWAKLYFLSNKNGKPILETLIQAGADNTPSVYTFPCHVRGHLTLGWSKESKGACDQGFIVNSKGGPWISQNSPTLASLSNLWQSSLVSDNGTWQVAQSPNPQAWYCSAISTGDAWGVAASPLSLDEACRNALEKCNQGNPDGNCTLASEGEWNIDETNLRVSSRCAGDSVRSRPGTGMNMLREVLPFMEKDTHFLNEKACIFDVFSPDSLVIAPSRTTYLGKPSTEPILIQIHQVQDDLAVDVLTGWVDVVSEGRPNGLKIKKGNGYRLKQNSSTDLTENGCKNIYNSPSMEIFFNRESWQNPDDEVTQAIGSRLTEYQNAFCYDVGKIPTTSSTPPVPGVDLGDLCRLSGICSPQERGTKSPGVGEPPKDTLTTPKDRGKLRYLPAPLPVPLPKSTCSDNPNNPLDLPPCQVVK